MLPVDSEHNAIHQCLHGRSPRSTCARLILTASGGPFRNLPAGRSQRVTPEDALRHPTWRMGPKITIDSATLMNKGLEVIEARWLFDVGPDRIDVVVHPQSIVHSMVELVDGSIIAQLGVTDMRLPIQYAFSYPDRWRAPLPPLDLTRAGRLDFEVPDTARFPCLALAFRALAGDPALPIVLNAANEVAVAAFLQSASRFHVHPRRHPRGDGRLRARRPQILPDSTMCAPSIAGPASSRRRRPLGKIAYERVGAVTTILAFIFVLGVLIFVHELGHFLMARRIGVRVLTFSLGFGPKLVSFRRGDTEYCVSAIPLGGYVKMAGENPEDARTGASDEFLSKTKWQRFQVLIMGPVMNLALAVLVMAAVLYQGRRSRRSTERRSSSDPSTRTRSAQAAGVHLGDRILSIDGRRSPPGSVLPG